MPRNILQLIQQQAELIDLRLDANETANLDRAFRYTEAQIQRIEYPALTSSLDIPLDASVPEWAQTVHYRVYDVVGSLAPIANFADDLPRSDVVLYEEEIPVKAWGGSYAYSIEDLQRAMAPGSTQLDVQRGLANREIAEESTDRTAYFGYKPFRIRGFTNNEFVELMAPNVDGGDTTWVTKIANGDSGVLSVAKDINDMFTKIKVDTKEVHEGTDCLLPTTLYELLRTTRFQANSDKTILSWLKENNPSVTFSSRTRLETANAAGSGPRIIAYKKSPVVLQHKLAMAYRTFPPQAKNLAFLVNGMMRTAGTHVYRPKAMKYLDGAG